MSNQATAAQASFIVALEKQVGAEAYKTAYDNARRLNGNADYYGVETITRQVRRLTKTAASKIISELIAVRDAK